MVVLRCKQLKQQQSTYLLTAEIAATTATAAALFANECQSTE